MTLVSRRNRRVLSATTALALVLTGAAGAAQAASDDQRLFHSFAEDATIVSTQWWEGSFEFSSYENVDVTALMLTGALRPMERMELGGRVGFGSTSADGSLSDGSGATDLDLWGKWHVGSAGGDTDFVVGGLATVPTGDDTAGLGYDAFNFEGFGAMRYRMPEAILAARLGFRINGDGSIQEYELDGKTSVLLSMGLIFPVSSQVALVGEANVESERWEGTDSDFRVLAGVNWRPLNKGIVRSAVSAGLTDGAPDFRFLAGFAYTF